MAYSRGEGDGREGPGGRHGDGAEQVLHTVKVEEEEEEEEEENEEEVEVES